MRFVSTKSPKILVALVLLIVLAFAIYFGRLNVFNKKGDSAIQQAAEEIVDETDRFNNKVNPVILFTPSPSPTPKPTPTGDSSVSVSSVSVRASPTPSKPPIFSTVVALGRASSAVPDQAQGRMDIQITDVADHSSGIQGYKIVSYKYKIVLENMEGDKEYWISLCYQNEGCSEFALIKTDNLGNALDSGEKRKSYDTNKPYWYIKVTQADTSGPCSSDYSPCLRGDFSLSL